MIWKLFCFLWCTPEKEKNKQKKRLDKQWICRWFGTPWCPCVAGWCFVFHPLKQKFDKGCEIMLLCYRRLYIPTAITCNVMNALPRMIPRVGHRFIVRRAGLLWSQQDFEWRWSVPLFKCLTVLEFSFILFDLCLLITFFNFIMNYVPIVTFWIFTYHKIWILSIMFCFIWSYWIIYFLACLEVSWRVVS